MEALYETAARFNKPNPGRQMVQEYKEQVKQQAEELVINQFPKIILELDALLKNEKFKTDVRNLHTELNIPIPVPLKNDTDEVCYYAEEDLSRNDDFQNCKKRKFCTLRNEIQGTKVLVLPNGTVPCNKHISEIVELVKPRILQLVEDANVLKMWIQFLIPRIEDGNNFGVSIQEDILGEIRSVESEAASYFDQFSRYFLARGKMVARVAKYPHVDDFRRTIIELDEKEFLSVRLITSELRNHYATLHDMITKNLEKIKKPRTSNADTMY